MSVGARIRVDTGSTSPSIDGEGTMTWTPPDFEEIRMDAELTAYSEDFVDSPAEPDRPACESES
jgi:hypothetical protein